MKKGVRMPIRYRLLSACCVAWLVACFAPAPAMGQNGLSAADTREIGAYVLTEGALAKYTQAAGNLSKLDKIPGLCADDDTDSLAAMVKRVDGVPAARNAITSAGLTTREFVVFTVAMFTNGFAALAPQGTPVPPGASKANVDFFRAHVAAFEAIPKSKDCGDDER